MYRAIMFWVNMAIRLAFWGSIAVLGVWVYNRGVDGFVEDAGGLIEHWMGEYERFSGEVKGRREREERQIRMKAERRGRGGTSGAWWD